MENYEISKNIESFKKRLLELRKTIDFEKMTNDIDDKQKMTEDPSFYLDIKKTKPILKELKKLTTIRNTFNLISELIDDLECLYTLQKENEISEADNDIEVKNIIENIETKLKEFEIELLLNGEYDDCDAIIELHPGAGGTESQDWALMLFRMYTRYASAHGFECEVVDYQDGEEAGIKSVSFVLKGDNAYGYLKSEHGVHRLVRISPFDSGARRHTSFAGCSVTPLVEDDINIDVRPEDVRVDTYRATGSGGQYVNKTDSAIRITHLKTGVVVTCQSQRNQLLNREKAMQLLKSKLYQLEKEQNEKKIKDISGDSSINGFGGQIRSYVFHPYSLVKDLRTGYETSNSNAVLDGDLDGLINAYLHLQKK